MPGRLRSQWASSPTAGRPPRAFAPLPRVLASPVVGLTLLGICMWANTIGALVPLLARRMGIDPAVISAPFISTLVDATGLVIYFTTAILLLIRMSH